PVALVIRRAVEPPCRAHGTSDRIGAEHREGGSHPGEGLDERAARRHDDSGWRWESRKVGRMTTIGKGWHALGGNGAASDTQGMTAPLCTTPRLTIRPFVLEDAP